MSYFDKSLKQFHTSYITIDGKIKGISSYSTTLILNDQNINELYIPEGIEISYIINNHIQVLILPSTLKELYCYDNPIKELIIPKSIKELHCNINTKILNIKDFLDTNVNIEYI